MLETLKDVHPLYYTKNGIRRLLKDAIGGDGKPRLGQPIDNKKLEDVINELEREGMTNARSREDSEEKEYQYNQAMSRSVM